MSLNEEKKMCMKHRLEIITIDLKQQTAKEDKYLCIKCLIEKIDIQNMAMVDETKIMIKEMKAEQQTLKIKKNQKRIENFKQVEDLIKQFKVQVEELIDKILINIHSRLQTIEKDLEESDLKSKFYNFEDEVEILSKHYKGSFNYEIPLELDKLDNDDQFYDNIQQMFQSLTTNQSYTLVIDNIQNKMIIDKAKEIKQSNIQNEKELGISEIPYLNIKCNKHGKEILMFNLDSNETQTSRLICVDCIHDNDPIKYTSLQDILLFSEGYVISNLSHLWVTLSFFTKILVFELVLFFLDISPLRLIQEFNITCKSIHKGYNLEQVQGLKFCSSSILCQNTPYSTTNLFLRLVHKCVLIDPSQASQLETTLRSSVWKLERQTSVLQKIEMGSLNLNLIKNQEIKRFFPSSQFNLFNKRKQSEMSGKNKTLCQIYQLSQLESIHSLKKKVYFLEY